LRQDIDPFTKLDKKQISAYLRLLARLSKLRETCVEEKDTNLGGLMVNFKLRLVPTPYKQPYVTIFFELTQSLQLDQTF